MEYVAQWIFTVSWRGWPDSNRRKVPELKSGALTAWRHPCVFSNLHYSVADLQVKLSDLVRV